MPILNPNGDKMSEIESIIEWYMLSGVEDFCADTPMNALQTADSPLPKKQNPATSENNAVRPAITPLSQINMAACRNAEELCRKAQTLDDLKAMVESFEGCPLKFSANSTVFGYGNPQAEVLIIGEAPGSDEDRLGEPFVGKSGQLLTKMLQTIGLDRRDCYITNVLPWRPPGNRTPTDEEVVTCLPFLKRQIELVSPKIIFILGRSAANTLLDNSENISSLRGHFIDYTTETGKVIPTLSSFHPAYLLRTASQKAKSWSDLLRLKRKLEEI